MDYWWGEVWWGKGGRGGGGKEGVSWVEREREFGGEEGGLVGFLYKCHFYYYLKKNFSRFF